MDVAPWLRHEIRILLCKLIVRTTLGTGLDNVVDGQSSGSTIGTVSVSGIINHVVLAADTLTASTGSYAQYNEMPIWYFYSYSKAEDSAVALLHFGFANSACADGHVGAYNATDLKNSGTNITAYMTYSRVLISP